LTILQHLFDGLLVHNLVLLLHMRSIFGTLFENLLTTMKLARIKNSQVFCIFVVFEVFGMKVGFAALIAVEVLLLCVASGVNLEVVDSSETL
jgi:hypothetical protein